MSSSTHEFCKNWRWSEGMVRTDGAICVHMYNDMPSVWSIEGRVHQANPDDYLSWEPDLKHPATLGCLLAFVREAWHGRNLWTMNMGGAWRVGDILGWAGPTGATEAEALVAALEAAPS